MPNPRGTPENLQPGQRKSEEPMTEQVSFRTTKEMKEAIKEHDDPAEFCRRAIQEALDKEKKK